jgi:alpha-tubulin suppressor-like RCC1 family protein
MTIKFRYILWFSIKSCVTFASQGYVVGWGDNTSGEATGVPLLTFSNGVISGGGSSTGTVVIANQVLSDATAIIASRYSSLALKRDGTVVGWGENGMGQAIGELTPSPGKANGVVRINNQILSNVVSIAGGNGFGMGLHKDGTVVSWGEKAYPVKLSNVVAISAGSFSEAYAVMSNGTVVSWNGEKAYSTYGQITSYPNLSNVVAVAIGEATHGPRAVALKRDSTVALFREDNHIYKIETPPEGLSNVVALAVGSNHTLALKRDGTVVGWGLNAHGEATGTPNLNPTNSFTSGMATIDGKVLKNVVSIAANTGYSMALKSDGTVVAWGHIHNDYRTPVTVPAGLSNVVAIAAGQFYSLAITTNVAVAERFRH